MIKFTGLITLFVLLSVSVFAKYRISTVYNETYEGELIDRTDTEVTFLTDGQITIKVPLSDIQSITPVNETSPVSKIVEPLIKDIYSYNNEYPFLGLTILHPGMINLNFGYNFQDYGIRAVLGTVPVKSYGFQLNFLYHIDTRASFEHNLSLGVGHSYIEDYQRIKENFGGGYKDQEWTYLGLFYDINFYGFFFEAGATVGDGTLNGLQLRAQFGYVYRFND